MRETIKGMRVYSFCPSLSLLFYLVSCMSAVEANKVCLAVLRANSSMDMLDYRGQTALLKKTFVLSKYKCQYIKIIDFIWFLFALKVNIIILL